MGTGTAASSIRPEDTRRSDSGAALRRRGRSARSMGKRPYASQVAPSSRSPWCAAPRPGGAVPQAIGRLACALDTAHGFRDLRTARTALGSGHPPGRRAVRHPPRRNEALPSGRASALAVSGGALLRLALPPRDVGVNGFVLPAVLPLVVFRQLRTAARRRAHAALGVRPVRSRQRANRRPSEPVVLHAVTSFPGARSGGRGVGPLVPCTNSSERRFIPPRPTGAVGVQRTVRSAGDIGWTVRCLQDVRQWARIEPLMPQAEGRSRPWRDHRQTVWRRSSWAVGTAVRGAPPLREELSAQTGR
jgi:hypothetical protein